MKTKVHMNTMLDVTSVGANLTPEQQEATLADLTFFLDHYGSTRAVRAKLKEQQREVQRLVDRLQQLLNGEDPREDEQRAAANGESVIDHVGDVDETMADVDFFLRVYGSTQAVRHELSVQKNKIEGLNKTIIKFQKHQELQDENVCETQELNGASGKSDLGEENNVQMELVQNESTGEENAGKGDCERGDKQAKASAEVPRQPRTDSIRESPPPRRSSRTCRHRNCNKLIQARGLCYAHGGYNICKVDNCDLRAANRKFCRFHGGVTQCKMSKCEKLSFSSGKGFCYRHAREQGIGVNHARENNSPQEEKNDDSGTGVIGSRTHNEFQAQSLDNGGDIHASNRTKPVYPIQVVDGMSYAKFQSV
ncbi:hypothetical protein V7S43_007348 [Phytophthora oleae]|uniref:WRKY19-like zinc finger domain-containing protein n=1 Tax=Phytophthora oleae TaxID=2107226 RepID=A0ABD3FN20_9STRA